LASGFNYDGPLSDSVSYYACMPPSNMEAPTRITSTTDSIDIQWQTPASNGGCPILGYAVFVDDGNSGLFTEVNQPKDI
jgi:hypothetical protein